MPILQPPKLYLNEHLSHQIAKQLRQHGFDVISTAEANMDSVDDDIQFAYAVSEQRAIVTFNHQDFAPLHISWLAEGKEHWGVILSTEVPMNVVRQRLLKLLHSVWAEDLKNQIRWLNEFK